MIKGQFHTWIQTASNITVIFTLFVALYSFWYQYEQDRDEHTINMAAKIFEDPLLTAQTQFLTELSKLSLEAVKGQNLSREFVAELVRQVVSESPDQINARNGIITLVNYYDRLAACVDTGLCNRTLLLEQVDPAATRFSCWIIPYIRVEREKMLLTGLGDGFAKFVEYESKC